MRATDGGFCRGDGGGVVNVAEVDDDRDAALRARRAGSAGVGGSRVCGREGIARDAALRAWLCESAGMKTSLRVCGRGSAGSCGSADVKTSTRRGSGGVKEEQGPSTVSSRFFSLRGSYDSPTFLVSFLHLILSLTLVALVPYAGPMGGTDRRLRESVSHVQNKIPIAYSFCGFSKRNADAPLLLVLSARIFLSYDHRSLQEEGGADPSSGGLFRFSSGGYHD